MISTIVLQLFERTKRCGLVPSDLGITSLLAALAGEGSGSREDGGCGGSSSATAAVPAAAAPTNGLAAEARSRAEKSGEVWLDLWGKEVEVVSTALIQPLLSAADTSADTSAARELLHVFEVFNEMRAAGVEADNAAFNALINACAEAGDVVRAEAALGQMMRTGLTPDVISYTSLIKACVVRGDAARAESVFQEMQQRTNHFSTFTPPSERTFRHMMAVHLSAADATRVLELMFDLRSRGLTPSATHYSLALRACALPCVCELPNSLRRATELYEAMRSDGLRLDNRGLLALDRLYRSHGLFDIAQRVRRERSMHAAPQPKTRPRVMPPLLGWDNIPPERPLGL